MRRLLTFCAIASFAIGAWDGESSAQGLAPGTIKLLSKNGVLIDATSADPFVQITSTEPGKFLIVGPATLQADFRVSLKPGEAEGGSSSLEILVGGKSLRRFAIKPRASADTWKERPDAKPAASVGFLMEVDPGPHAYEFRFSGADKGAGLMLVPQAKAKHALAANAPLVPAKPPAPVATPTAIAVATPVATPKPKSVDEIGSSGGRSASARMDRLGTEVALLGGFGLPGDSTFKADGSTTLEARWGLGASRALAVGVSVSRSHFGGVAARDPARAVPASAVNIDMTPVIAHLTWYLPLDGLVRPYVAGGPGFTVAQSSMQTRTTTTNELQVGPAADAVLGVQFDLGASDIREGRQKILVEARESWGSAAFAAHDFKNFSSTELMLGVALKF